MAMTPEMDTARIERTMRVLEYVDDKPKIKRFLEEPLEDPEARRWLKQPRIVFYTTLSKIIFTTLQKM